MYAALFPWDFSYVREVNRFWETQVLNVLPIFLAIKQCIFSENEFMVTQLNNYFLYNKWDNEVLWWYF